jgi:WD40 repeat protein
MKRPKTREAKAARAWGITLSDFVAALSWSPDDEVIAAATLSGSVDFVDAQTGKVRRSLAPHEGGAHAVAWSPTGALVATGGEDGRVAAFDARTGERVFESAMKGWVEHLAWSKDGSCLAAAAGKAVRFLSQTGAPLGNVLSHASTVTSLLFHPATARFVSTCYGGVSFLEPGRAEPVRHLPWKGSILSSALSPDGRWIACGNQDGTVHVWEIASGQDLEMSGYPTKVRELAWSTRGPQLATGGGANVTIWSFGGQGPAGSRPVELTGHKDKVTGIAFVDHVLLTVGADGLFHGATAGATLKSSFVDEVGASLYAVVPSPSGRCVVAPATAGRLYAWTLSI